MRSETQPYSTVLQYSCVALRMRFFSQNFGTINEFYQGLRHRLTAKALGPRLPRTQALHCFYRDQWQLINANGAPGYEAGRSSYC